MLSLQNDFIFQNQIYTIMDDLQVIGFALDDGTVRLGNHDFSLADLSYLVNKLTNQING